MEVLGTKTKALHQGDDIQQHGRHWDRVRRRDLIPKGRCEEVNPRSRLEPRTTLRGGKEGEAAKTL